MRLYDTDTFWGRVRETADRRGISLKELAEKAGMPYGTMTNSISTGTVPRKTGAVKKLAEVLGVDPEYLTRGGEAARDLRLTPQEAQLVLRYRLLSPALKRALEDTLGYLEEIENAKNRAGSEILD